MAGRLSSFGGDAVVLLIVELDLDGDAARGLHDRLIGHPRRVEHEHLVALVQDGLYGEIDGVLAAGGDEDAVFVVLQPVLLAQLLRDGRAQLGKARPHDVVRIALAQAADGRHGDAVRGGEVRLAAGKADDRGIVFCICFARAMSTMEAEGFMLSIL